VRHPSLSREPCPAGLLITVHLFTHPFAIPTMFAYIETNNATHIAIRIPEVGADKTIPALVGMLENNAIFINKGYGTLETRKPKMSIVLGDSISLEGNDSELVVFIPDTNNIIDDSFVIETPEVRISNKKAIEAKDKEISRLRNELAVAKQQLESLRESILSHAEEM
jgi:hypothetical protein